MHKNLHLHGLIMDNLILNPICITISPKCGCNLKLHPFYSEPRSYLDAEKNHYARIADSDHNSYFSPRVNGLP